jgi:nucleoside-diphosphate-sugar epimerase
VAKPRQRLDGSYAYRQHITKHRIEQARNLLGWEPTDPHEALRRSVAWHLAHPPDDASGDLGADDRALAAAA